MVSRKRNSIPIRCRTLQMTDLLHVLHPLSDHWNIGMWGIYLGDDPDQRPQEKISAAVTEQVKWLIGCLYDSDHIRLKRKAGQSYAEMLGFRTRAKIRENTYHFTI